MFRILFKILIASISHAQEDPGWMTFSGSADLNFRYRSYTTGAYQYGGWETQFSLQPVMHIAGFEVNSPISMTRNQGGDQSFDAYSLRVRRTWMQAEVLQIHPALSPLLLQDISLKGVNLELTPAKFRLKLFMGSRANPTGAAGPVRIAARQTLYGGVVGLGSEDEGFHAAIQLLHAADAVEKQLPGTSKVTDSTIGASDAITGRSPQDNTVVAVRTGLALFDQAVRVNAEFAGSVFSADTRLPRTTAEELPGFLPIYMTTHYDISYALSARYRSNSSEANIAFSSLGPGYYSAGVPFMQTDIQEFSLQVEQAIFDRTLTLSFGYRNSRDNLLRQKTSTLRVQDYLPGLLWRFRDASVLQVTFRRSVRENDADNPLQASSVGEDYLTVSLTHAFGFLGVRHSLSASVVSQSLASQNPGSIDYSLRSNVVSLMSSHAWSSFSLFFGANWTSMTSSAIQASHLGSLTTRLSGHVIGHIVTGSLTCTYSFRDQNGTGDRRLRIGVASGIVLNRFLQLRLEAMNERTVASMRPGTQPAAVFAQASLLVRW